MSHLTLEQELLHADFAHRMKKASPEELLETVIAIHEKFWLRENQHKEALKLAARLGLQQ